MLDFKFKETLSLLEEKNTEYSLSIKQLKRLQKQEEQNNKDFLLLEKLKTLIVSLGEQTQQEAIKYIEETVTLALQAVFLPDFDYVFSIDVAIKRDQQEFSFLITDGGVVLDPKDDVVAGGTLDVCSFALKMINLSLKDMSSFPVVFVDEAFKNLSKKYHEASSDMMKQISNLLNIQLIHVSHIPTLINAADNVINLNDF